MRGKNWLEVLKMCAKTQEVLKLAKKISCNYLRYFCMYNGVIYIKKIAEHHSKDLVIHPYMTEKSQNKVRTLTLGHPE